MIAIEGRYIAEHSVFISDQAVDTTVYIVRCRCFFHIPMHRVSL